MPHRNRGARSGLQIQTTHRNDLNANDSSAATYAGTTMLPPIVINSSGIELPEDVLNMATVINADFVAPNELETHSLDWLQGYYSSLTERLKKLIITLGSQLDTQITLRQIQPNTATPPSSVSLSSRSIRHRRAPSGGSLTHNLFMTSINQLLDKIEEVRLIILTKTTKEMKSTLEQKDNEILVFKKELEEKAYALQEKRTEAQKAIHERNQSAVLLDQLQNVSDAFISQTLQKEISIIENGCTQIDRDIHAATDIRKYYETIDTRLKNKRSKLIGFAIWLSHYALKCWCTNSPRKEQLALIEDTATMLKNADDSFNRMLDRIAKSIKLNPNRLINTASLATNDGGNSTRLLDTKQALSIQTLTKALIMFGCLEIIRVEIAQENKIAPSRLEQVIKILQMSLERHISEVSGGLNIKKKFHKLAEHAYRSLLKHRDPEQAPLTENATGAEPASVVLQPLSTDTPSLFNQKRTIGRSIS